MGNEPNQKQQREESRTGLGSEDRIEAKIDRDLRDSFSASDPPGWVLGVKRRDSAEQNSKSPSPPPTDDTKSE